MDTLWSLARRGVWALPVYAVLLLVATATQQPDYRTDFAGYAAYVTTGWFLLSHVVASVAGSVVGVVGVTSLAVVLALGGPPHRAASAVGGAVAAAAGSVLMTAGFGAAAFAQPAIGRAYLGGSQEAAVALNADVYGTPLFAVAGAGVLSYVTGGLLVGRAVAAASSRLRATGVVYAVLTPVLVLAGMVGSVAQPVAAGALVLTTTLIARRLPAAPVAPTAGAARRGEAPGRPARTHR